MANVIFPATLNRKQYLIRCLIAFIVVAAAFLFFVAAPTGTPVRVAGILLQVVALLAFLYHMFGLAMPRLKNAKLSVLLLLLAIIPFGVVILFVICAVAPEKT